MPWAISSSWAAGMRPSLAAATIWSSVLLGGISRFRPALSAATRVLLGGISRFRPALSAATRSLTAPQSDMTMPLKPHSPRSTSVSSQRFCEENTPLILLYEHMTVHGWAVLTMYSKAGR